MPLSNCRAIVRGCHLAVCLEDSEIYITVMVLWGCAAWSVSVVMPLFQILDWRRISSQLAIL